MIKNCKNKGVGRLFLYNLDNANYLYLNLKPAENGDVVLKIYAINEDSKTIKQICFDSFMKKFNLLAFIKQGICSSNEYKGWEKSSIVQFATRLASLQNECKEEIFKHDRDFMALLDATKKSMHEKGKKHKVHTKNL